MYRLAQEKVIFLHGLCRKVQNHSMKYKMAEKIKRPTGAHVKEGHSNVG
jgi:hypothetical protein